MIKEIIIATVVFLLTSMLVYWLWQKRKQKHDLKINFDEVCDKCPDDYKKYECVPSIKCLTCGECLTDNSKKCCANCNTVQNHQYSLKHDSEHCHHHQRHHHPHSCFSKHDNFIAPYFCLFSIPILIGMLIYCLWKT